MSATRRAPALSPDSTSWGPLVRAEHRPWKGPASGPFACSSTQPVAVIGLATVFARRRGMEPSRAPSACWLHFRTVGEWESSRRADTGSLVVSRPRSAARRG
jgi:hypothetical protein